MGEQFFEVFKPKTASEQAAEEEREAAEEERAKDAGPAPTQGVGLAFGQELQQAAGVSRTARPGDERAITFRFEEVVVMLIGAMMLMVICFLLGWYGHARTSAATMVAPAVAKVPEAPDELGEMKPFDPKPLDVKAREKGPEVERAAPKPKPGATYSLEVIRFAAGDRGTADATKKKLEARGYAPVFFRTSGREISVYVGRFASRTDPRIEKYRKEIRAMSRHYRWCDVKRVQ